jgi:ketosteroid isomerase-like protein
MNQTEMDAIMSQFRRAYGTANTEGLEAILTSDFEWHTHIGASETDSPRGRVIKGVDNLVKELKWRGDNWARVKYANLVERPAGDVILQTFTISGINEAAKPFHVNVVDLYSVRDGRIYRKDTYWKQV